MSTTQTPSDLATTAETAAGVVQFLAPVVIDLEALVVQGKQAHWHVRGTAFDEVHRQLDQIVANAQEFADTAAERIVALGLPLDSRLKTVAEKNTLPDLPDGFRGWEETVANVTAQLDAALVTIRTAVAELETIDMSSQDVAIEIERGVTKDRWLLQAHLAS
ncbi:hypothetical protein LUZ63_020453 [Rhynchospora breviuscula]|uniref:Ferritin/DPS domain-containing protein n=1 Tax=Rhynchospora breviuscula TaxID=2022672 RepID=A0A9P9Z876_9POAL|nr:hypothetical protein LUZ63_020453 [Rhynchospora breviuscula]